jgi:outer membrane murein-binding lipoprotein Lpp
MIDLIASLLGGGNTILVLLGAAFAASVAIFMKGRSSGKSSMEKAVAKRDAKAKEERLEMNREASEIEKENARLSMEEAKKKAERWANKQ